jgi:hypothetical protein
MDIQSAVKSHPFELVPVLIPGWVIPVLPEGIAYAGIPHSLYDDQPNGLQCVIFAWTSLKSGPLRLDEGDRVDLYVNNRFSGAGFTVQEGEQDKEFFFLHLPHDRLDDGVNTLHYKVTRVSQNAEDSLGMDVLYHRWAPGYPVLVIPPDVIKEGVTADRAEAGVEFGFTYDFQRQYDRIDFLVGRVTIPVEVLDDSAPVTHTLRTETFKLAGDNPRTPLQFRVTDQLGNSNQSSIEYIAIHLNQELVLDPPSVKEAVGAILNPVNAKNTLTIVVPTNADLLPTDKLKVIWTGAPGTPADGSHTSGESLVSAGLEIPIPNSVVAFNLGKSVTVTYVVIHSGVELPPSPALTLNVQAIPEASLTIPLIPQAAQGGLGSQLDLTSFTGDALVTVAPWPLIAVGQKVWLRCEGTASDGSNYPIPLYTASGVVEGEVTAGLSKPLLRSELLKLRDGSDLRIILQVTFDHTNVQANAVDFPLRSYAIVSAPLSIDPSRMTLHGLYIDAPAPWVRNTFVPPGTSETRRPQGGVPPYRYTSSDPAVATVDADGTVSVTQMNGVALITAFDVMNRQVSYPVSVTNIFKLEVREEWVTSDLAYSWGNFGNYSFHPIEEKYSLLTSMYYLPGISAGPYWTCGRSAVGSYWIDLRNGYNGVHPASDPGKQLLAVRLVHQNPVA